MEERVVRLLVEVVEVAREMRAMREEVAEERAEVRAMREEVAEERAEDAAGDGRVLAVAVLGLVVGLGHLVQGWWRWRRQGRHRGEEGGEALSEVVTIGRTEEAAVSPIVPGEGDLERVEVVREGGATGEEGVDARGGVGRGGRVRGGEAECWRCLLVSRL